MTSARQLLLGILASVLSCAAQEPPALALRPVIYALDAEGALAMRSAPVILVIEITKAALTGDMRVVAKPPGTAGPDTPTIPLYLARIRAKVLLTLRGPVRTKVEFYSWVWASGKHGGSRLFNPLPGSNHVIFLQQESRYLHTVGDYPSYDLELNSRLMPALLAEWHSGRGNADNPLERLVACRLHAEFDNLSASEVYAQFKDSVPIPREYYLHDVHNLVRLAGDLFLANQLDDVCRHSTNRFGRIAACDVTGSVFPGRCQAYRLAQEAGPEQAASNVLARALTSCEARAGDALRALQSNDQLFNDPSGWERMPGYRREVMRVSASAMDAEVHKAACEVAATMPEARDIPECAVPGQK